MKGLKRLIAINAFYKLSLLPAGNLFKFHRNS